MERLQAFLKTHHGRCDKQLGFGWDGGGDIVEVELEIVSWVELSFATGIRRIQVLVFG